MTILADCRGPYLHRKRESSGLKQRIKEDCPSEAPDTQAWSMTRAFPSSDYFAGDICWLTHHRGLFLEGTQEQHRNGGREGDWLW